MSWRAESTFKPSSRLTDEEKEYLKLAKKLREILKLVERQNGGEVLEGLQLEKVSSKDKLLKEVAALAVKLPGETEVLEKNQDITDLLDPSIVEGISKKRQQDKRRFEQRMEREQQKKDEAVFMPRHDKPIVDVTLSADGGHIFTCSKDKYVLCWSLKERLMQVVATFGGHKGAVFAVDAVAGPCGLVSGGADGEMHFWQGDTAKLRPGSVVQPSATTDHGGIVRVLRWCPFDDASKPGGARRLASASEKLVSKPPAICVWSVSERGRAECLLRIDDAKVLPGKANDLRWGGGATLKLFSAHDNGYVGVWSTEAPGALLKTIKLHTAPIISLALSSDGTTLVTASHDMSSNAVDVSTRETNTVMTYKANRPLNAVCLSPEFKAGAGGAGRVVLAGGKNARDVTTQVTLEDEFESKVLDAATGEETASTVKAHFGPVHRFLALPKLGRGGAFASVSEDGCVKVHGLDGNALHSDVIE